jgi:hypothetical protein
MSYHSLYASVEALTLLCHPCIGAYDYQGDPVGYRSFKAKHGHRISGVRVTRSGDKSVFVDDIQFTVPVPVTSPAVELISKARLLKQFKTGSSTEGFIKVCVCVCEGEGEGEGGRKCVCGERSMRERTPFFV